MTQTPYSLLLKKERDRKDKLTSNIQSKDLKHRSISYNLKITSESGQDPQKGRPKQKMRMSFHSSIKKSYICRKFFNRTAEGIVTCQDFCKFKEQVNKGHTREGKEDTFFFKGQRQKCKTKKDNEEGLQLIIKSKQTEKEDKHANPSPTLAKKKSAQEKTQKIENISDIAERRKLSLDFDLQILGNKKKLKMKEGTVTKTPSKKLEEIEKCNDIHPENICSRCLPKEFSLRQPNQNMRPPCTFFKKFQGQNYQQEDESPNSFNFNIKKIKQNLGNIPDLAFEEDWVFGRSNTTDHKPNLQLFRSIDTAYQLRKEIRSSWQQGGDRRYTKLQTAEERRYNIRKSKPVVSFTNDIKGWNVKNLQEEEEEDLFGDQ